MTPQQLISIQKQVRQIKMDQNAFQYAVRLARASRPESSNIEEIKRYIHFGAGPRASQYLSIGARVRAALDGRPNADARDVASVAKAVLQHRLVRNFRAEAERVSSQDIVDMLLKSVAKS